MCLSQLRWNTFKERRECVGRGMITVDVLGSFTKDDTRKMAVMVMVVVVVMEL